MNTNKPNATELLLTLKLDAARFTAGTRIQLTEKGGVITESVKSEKVGVLYLAGTLSSLPISAESLILNLGTIVAGVEKGEIETADTYAADIAGATVAVCNATAKIMSLKGGIKADLYKKTDSTVKAAEAELAAFIKAKNPVQPKDTADTKEAVPA